MNKARVMACEAKMYWCAVSAGRRLKRHGFKAEDQVDELEAIAMNSDWPRLKAYCAAAITALTSVAASAQEAVACVL